MSRTKKQIDYILTKRKIQVVEEFTFVSKPTKFKCLICDHCWTTTPFKIINQKTGCPKCAGSIKLTTDEFISKAKSIHGTTYDYTNTKYSSALRPILVECKFHGPFSITPNKHISARQGCPTCAFNTLLTNEQFDTKLKKAQRGIVRVGNYCGSHVPITVKCEYCLYSWKAKPTKLHGKRATGCPKCRSKFGTPTTVNGITFRSILESACYTVVQEACKNNGLSFEHQKRYPQSTTNHTCDFYIPEVQLWIEVSGIKTEVYKSRLQKKISWVKELNENFLFVQTPDQLRKILNGKV
jgi:Zn finger protein HypA/HybF involved in hydrogenase expression